MASFLDRHGLLAAFVFLLIEEAGVPVPVPGDFLMLYLGVRAGEGRVPLWQAIVVMELATVLGATFLYVAARMGGRGLVYRYGRYIRLTPERLDGAEKWLIQHGSRAVFFGRLLPGLRILTAVACGVFSVPAMVYIPAMALGALFYIVVYTLLGYYFGQQVLDLVEELHLPFGLLGSMVPLGILVWWTARARQGIGLRATRASTSDHEQELRAGAAAGALATIGSTLFLNVVINLAGNIAFNAPATIIDRTVQRLAFGFAFEAQPMLLFVVVLAGLVVGVLWGALYGRWFERRLNFHADWFHGVAYAMLLPLLASMLIVMPLVGLGFFGVGGTGVVALIGETLRHVAYGALLGLIYPVLRVRRTVRVLPHTPEELAPEGAA